MVISMTQSYRNVFNVIIRAMNAKEVNQLTVSIANLTLTEFSNSRKVLAHAWQVIKMSASIFAPNATILVPSVQLIFHLHRV